MIKKENLHITYDGELIISTPYGECIIRYDEAIGTVIIDKTKKLSIGIVQH